MGIDPFMTFFSSLKGYKTLLKSLTGKFKSNLAEVFLGKVVLKICSKITGEHPCRSAISINRHRCSPVNLLHIFRTSFPKNTSGGLVLYLETIYTNNQLQLWQHLRSHWVRTRAEITRSKDLLRYEFKHAFMLPELTQIISSHRRCSVINGVFKKLLRTPILKNIWERMLRSDFQNLPKKI